VVHAYDLFFYLSSSSTLSYLWSEQRRYVLAFGAAVLAIVIVASCAYCADSTRVRPSRAAALLLFSAIAAGLSAHPKGERRHMQFYYENLSLSSFYASWGETVETLLRGALLEASAQAGGPQVVVPSSCKPDGRPPHIILIHEESVVQPSLFASLHYD